MPNTKLLQANIIELLEIEDFPEDKKYEIIEKSVDLVQKRVFLRVIQNLPQGRKDELMRLLEKEGGVEERASFLEAHCPRFYEWLEEEIARVKAELRVVAAKLRGLEETVEGWTQGGFGDGKDSRKTTQDE